MLLHACTGTCWSALGGQSRHAVQNVALQCSGTCRSALLSGQSRNAAERTVSVLLVVLTLVQVLMLVLMLVRQLVLVLVLVLVLLLVLVVLLLPLLLLRYAVRGTRYNCDVVGGRGCHKAELREKRLRGKR